MIGVSKESYPYAVTEEKLKPTIKSKTIEVYQPEISTPMYYLVTGSFMDKVNAQQFSEQMVNMGFKPYLLPLTDGYYRVGIFSSPYKEDVTEYKKDLVSTPMKMWVTYQ